MPSASKGRYQSRLFNFFHKQSRRFGEGFGRSLRQLQVATSWSLEALSKSIYLLLQKAVDSAGTQLSAAKEESKLKLQPSEPSADTAIVRILENIETQYIPSLDNSQLSISTTSKTNIVPLTSYSLSNQESEFIKKNKVFQISEQDARTTINQISEEGSDTTLKYSPQKIRAIASQLSNQNLVLVTSENEILDILTLSQQQILQNKIIAEI
ncbi:MAG: hypothetical protein HC907_02465, partial [Richelia sp. SM1_7_0]|nr:hypothetical protein [Richelia sp. SM1_7_0]